MSYVRGERYLWRDDERLHVWVADGDDGWRDSGWGETHSGGSAEGVSVPLDIIDDFVVMRLAELLDSGTLDDVVNRAVARYHGNGGCVALEALAGPIKRAVGGLKPRAMGFGDGMGGVAPS